MGNSNINKVINDLDNKAKFRLVETSPRGGYGFKTDEVT